MAGSEADYPQDEQIHAIFLGSRKAAKDAKDGKSRF
jgi:hypothetical protein